jgi:hypothetical protein
MRSKKLQTVYNVVASNYSIQKLPEGKYLHSFTPFTTNTVYEFIENEVPVITEGKNYNIGYTQMPDGRKIVDPSALALASAVNPMLSYLYAENLANEKYAEEKEKNDTRVLHQATDDYYWAKKHAWRMFGAFMAEDAFIKYLDEIEHKSVPCIMTPPDHPRTQSTAYAETGLEEAAYLLLSTAVKVNASMYKSDHYSGKFIIKGLNAISHKK